MPPGVGSRENVIHSKGANVTQSARMGVTSRKELLQERLNRLVWLTLSKLPYFAELEGLDSGEIESIYLSNIRGRTLTPELKELKTTIKVFRTNLSLFSFMSVVSITGLIIGITEVFGLNDIDRTTRGDKK